MNKTGETSFYFRELEVVLDEGVFVPNGVLNQLRRDALAELEENMLQKYFRNLENKAEENLTKKSKKTAENEIAYIAACETMAQVDKCLESKKLSTIYVDSQMFDMKNYVSELKVCIDKIHQAGKSVALRLPAIFREHTALFFKSIIDDLKNLPLDGLIVRNYEEVHFLSTSCPQLPLIADYNLYTYNDWSKDSFEKLGVSYTTMPLELNQREIRGRANGNTEILIYGHYPLMFTANCVHKNTYVCDKKPGVLFLQDRYHVLFPVKNFCNACYNVIYNSVPTCLFKEQKNLMDMGLQRMRLEFTIEGAEETRNILQLLEGKGKEIEYTNGHYKRGVE